MWLISLLFPPHTNSNFSQSFLTISKCLLFSLSHSDTYTQTHTSQPVHTYNLRTSRHWMVSECEKGTSSSVYQALLSTHPFPQWPHWGWTQVKAYLKDLFNTEKRGHIPETTGKGVGGGVRDSQQAPHPPTLASSSKPMPHFISPPSHCSSATPSFFFKKNVSFKKIFSTSCAYARVRTHVNVPQCELNRGQGPAERRKR